MERSLSLCWWLFLFSQYFLARLFIWQVIALTLELGRKKIVKKTEEWKWLLKQSVHILPNWDHIVTKTNHRCCFQNVNHFFANAASCLDWQNKPISISCVHNLKRVGKKRVKGTVNNCLCMSWWETRRG